MNDIEKLFNSSTVQKAFAKHKLFCEEAQLAVLNDYVQEASDIGVEAYIDENFIRMEAIKLVLDTTSAPTILVIEHGIDDVFQRQEALKQFFIAHIDVYSQYYVLKAADFETVLIPKLREFLSIEYKPELTEDEEMIASYREEVCITTALAARGIACKPYTNNRLIAFDKIRPRDMSIQRWAQEFDKWLVDNLVPDEIINIILGYPDPKGFIRKAFKVETLSQVVSVIKVFLAENTGLLQEYYLNHLSERELETRVNLGIRDFARSKGAFIKGS